MRHLLTAAASAALLMPVAGPVTATDMEELRETARMLFGTVRATEPEEIADPVAQLGQALFWDMRLSSNGATACASCHFRENWGSDSRVASINARGGRTLQSQTVFHAMETPGLRWLADRATGQAQAMGSITGSMGFASRPEILPVMAEHGYEEMFAAAFPGEETPMTVENYGLALQTYQFTLRTPAAYDAWLAGDDSAMTAQQIAGLETYINVGCSGCHAGPLFGGEMLQPFGVVEAYWEHTGSVDINSGLMRATGDAADRFFFRVPLLRNIAQTYPYFHDGSVADLRRATDIMARIQLGQRLDDQQLDDIVAFLDALTGEIPVNFEPPEGIPFELPAGVAAN
jgi:cytochrome c peroxidase